MTYFLFVLYALIGTYILGRSRLFRHEGKTIPYIKIIFIIKVSASLAYSWLYKNRFGGGDTWSFYEDSTTFYNLLYTQPAYFFKILFGYFWPTPEGFPNYIVSFYNYKFSGNMLLIRFNMILQPLSQGSFWIHSIFMGFLLTIAFAMIYRLLSKYIRLNPLLASIILIAPLTSLFYTTGIHKDGFAYLFIILLVFFFDAVVKTLNAKNIIGVLFSLMGLYLVRSHLLILILPLLVSWIVAQNLSYPKFKTFLFSFGILFVLGVLLNTFMSETHQIPQYLSTTQMSFKELGGHSYFDTPDLKPTWTSIIQYMPTALKNGFFRPYLSDATDTFKLINSLEIIGFYFFILICILFRRKTIIHQNFFYFLLGFGLMLCLLDGYILSNIGVLVRYRSIAYNFICIYFGIGVLDINRLMSWVKSSKKLLNLKTLNNK